MTGYESKRAAARDKLDDDDDAQIYQTELTKLLMESYDRGVADALEETKKALAHPAQEPVAWKETDEVECPVCKNKGNPWPKCGHITYLERTPPQRPWVGLTNAEKDGKRVLENGLLFNAAEVQAWELGVDYSEAKLKEKNNAA